jgi:hypothetical protein
MSFKKGKDPKDALSIGIRDEVEKWFDKENKANANHIVSQKGNIFTIQVHGSLVLERFNSTEILGKDSSLRVEIGEVSGTYIILNLLSMQQIYEKIKSFYIRVLDDCLGKSPDEQYKYLFGKEPEVIEAGRVKIIKKLKEGKIENSKNLIRGLPDVPSKQELINIANEIISGKLEYAYNIKDEFSVEMSQYANEIIKRFKNS